MSTAQTHGYETWGAKFTRKVKENPWVPLGCLATTGALVMSAVKMRRGQSQQMNYWMRARVGLQGITLVALVAGSMALQAERNKASTEQPAIGGGEELARHKESEEFEERLKGAEETHWQEAGLRAKVVKGPTVVKRESQSGPQTGTSNSFEVPAGAQKEWWKLW